jgi:hypothetical protein
MVDIWTERLDAVEVESMLEKGTCVLCALLGCDDQRDVTEVCISFIISQIIRCFLLPGPTTPVFTFGGYLLIDQLDLYHS